ncbi:glycoside hydrolase family 3 protein [Pseudocercospora fijiensis CIRAD86]|uniref:beta-glucosidase n=1 Tax=Pseudocercospora fijiensis (strain CIRAD86) TaxID=383855 RepID=M3AZ03_PSEFD|nr:glycoside hydrolase family 3 protein [Pseudocercospora fijiensis CIRAD86]EME82408.1 glycoside hydrolase family 3 protein [Pseudocercospora fijiensis CIRAD86]
MRSVTLTASLASAAYTTTLPASNPWASAYAKASTFVANLTLSELNNVTLGYSVGGTLSAGNACSGVSGSVPRLGFPGLCFQDAGNGVRAQDGVSSFASGISVGASWNAELAYVRGKYMGAEFQRKGVNVALGPVIGPVGRIAEGGRNWEGFGADPYLDGILVAPTIKGLQESAIACTKHFLAYEQETNRTASSLNENGLAVDSILDDKTLHEVYLWPFHDAVEAGTGSIMCAYNRVNGSYACDNDYTQNQLLKNELGFKGFIVSDWGAQHSFDTAKNGLDVVMPDSEYWNNDQLAQAVRNGTLSRDRLEDMALRTIATWYFAGQDSSTFPATSSGPGFAESGNLTLKHTFVKARDPASAPSILQGAQEGHVLVKNTNNALPLKKPNVLSLFGYGATAEPIFGPDVVAGAFGPNTTADLFNFNWQLLGEKAYNAFYETIYAPHTFPGVMFTAGGPGANTPPYISTPFDALTNRAIEDGTQLFWNFDQSNTNPAVEGASDAAIIFLNEWASEGWDRWDGLTDGPSDELVKNIAAQCSNTIVVIHNAGARIDAGRALVQILHGDVSPSGRMPYTLAKSESDYGHLLKGVKIDYRSFLARNVTLRYEFGYGLTYTTFPYSDFAINIYQPDVTGLFDTVGTVSIRVTNTGDFSTAEVSQLYLQIPGANTRALRGFQKTPLAPGASKPVTFSLRKKDISTWDSDAKRWVQPKGTYQVFVGKSVLDIQAQGSFTI